MLTRLAVTLSAAFLAAGVALHLDPGYDGKGATSMIVAGGFGVVAMLAIRFLPTEED